MQMRLSPFKAVLAVVAIATIYVLFSPHASAPGTDTSKLHLSGATTIVQSVVAWLIVVGGIFGIQVSDER